MLGVGDEVGGDISTVPLETLNVLDFGLKGLAFADSDGAVWAKLVEDTADEATDVVVVVG